MLSGRKQTLPNSNYPLLDCLYIEAKLSMCLWRFIPRGLIPADIMPIPRNCYRRTAAMFQRFRSNRFYDFIRG